MRSDVAFFLEYPGLEREVPPDDISLRVALYRERPDYDDVAFLDPDLVLQLARDAAHSVLAVLARYFHTRASHEAENYAKYFSFFGEAEPSPLFLCSELRRTSSGFSTIWCSSQ